MEQAGTSDPVLRESPEDIRLRQDIEVAKAPWRIIGPGGGDGTRSTLRRG